MVYLRRSCAFFLILAALFLASCGQGEKSSRQVIDELLGGIKELPEGMMLSSGSVEGSEEYLSDSMRDLLYGGKAGKDVFPLLCDYSIYLSSFEYPFELAVFRCYSKSDTDEVAAMCFSRCDSIKVLLHQVGVRDTNTKVMIKGRYVVMYLGTSPTEVERAFMAAVG